MYIRYVSSKLIFVKKGRGESACPANVFCVELSPTSHSALQPGITVLQHSQRPSLWFCPTDSLKSSLMPQDIFAWLTHSHSEWSIWKEAFNDGVIKDCFFLLKAKAYNELFTYVDWEGKESGECLERISLKWKRNRQEKMKWKWE